VFHANATVAPKLTLAGFIALFEKELRAGQQGITLLTWSPVALLQPEFLSLKSQSGYSGRTENTRWHHARPMAEQQVVTL